MAKKKEQITIEVGEPSQTEKKVEEFIEASKKQIHDEMKDHENQKKMDEQQEKVEEASKKVEQVEQNFQKLQDSQQKTSLKESEIVEIRNLLQTQHLRIEQLAKIYETSLRQATNMMEQMNLMFKVLEEVIGNQDAQTEKLGMIASAMTIAVEAMMSDK
jgi:hypothetical protein